MAAASRLLSGRGIYGLLEALPLGLGKTVFDPGFSILSMPKVIRCLGACSLKAIDPLNAHRNAIADIYRGTLGDTKTPPAPPESRAVFTRFPVMAGMRPIPKSLYQLGVRRMYPKAILDEPSIHPYCAPGSTSHPGASRIAEMLITLPTHTGISNETAREIAAGVREAYSW
jgi:dTDP-4-amino-4,6-dideoxygalactose transaminase